MRSYVAYESSQVDENPAGRRMRHAGRVRSLFLVE